MIKRIEHKRKMYVKSFDAGFKDKSHLEVHLATKQKHPKLFDGSLDF